MFILCCRRPVSDSYPFFPGPTDSLRISHCLSESAAVREGSLTALSGMTIQKTKSLKRTCPKK